jgi:hypothetical protein
MVKKLISIGVALALLTMVVVPGVVAAQEIKPSSYAKIPFAILGSGIQLVGKLVDAEAIVTDNLPAGLDVPAATELVAQWTAGPLGWSVDMLAWAISVVSDLVEPVLSHFASGYEWMCTEVLDTLALAFTDCWVPVECPLPQQ